MADLADILGMLPLIMTYADIVLYFVFSLFLGSIAVFGIRRRMSYFVKTPISLALGFVCVIAGNGLASFMPVGDDLLRAFQLDVFLGSLAVAAAFSFSLFLMTRKGRHPSHGAIMENLHKTVIALENLLHKNRVPIIPESEAKKIAEKELQGFKAKSAKTKEDAWEIALAKEKEEATVFLGIYDGTVRNVIHRRSPATYFLSDPLRIVGIAIIAAVLGFSLLNFQGFQGFTTRLAPYLGLSPEGLGGLFQDDSNLPPGCVSATKLALQYKPSLEEYQSDDLKSLITQESGLNIMWMYSIDYNGRPYVLAIDSDFANICSATETMLCNCIKVPEF